MDSITCSTVDRHRHMPVKGINGLGVLTLEFPDQEPGRETTRYPR